LLLVEDFHGWDSLDAAKADYHFATDQYRHVKRCAFVSEKDWHKWAVRLLDPFTRRTDEKFFELGELEKAWAWVRQPSKE
ncbi:MAG TPA: STAS/SEC14 domain-containing protein, partial [Anaerolineales bacterium]|nr:STAS/SEC14 domain-containing protein [Anaerolineales bacterium]